jgi:hypothetical protein
MNSSNGESGKLTNSPAGGSGEVDGYREAAKPDTV